jgi:transcriptional regulator with XRE-family HTH domain
MDRKKELPTMQARLALGEHLRSLRDGEGWTQPTLEEVSSVGVATIRSIENAYEGRSPTKRTLMLLSQAFDKPDDYFQDYLTNPPAEQHIGLAKEPVSEPGAIKVPPPRSRGNLIEQRLDKIIVDRLEEMVVPRLKHVENQVHALVDVMHNAGYEIEIYDVHPGDTE